MKKISLVLLAITIVNVSAFSAWVNVTSNLAGKACGCGGVYCMVAVPGQNKIIIGICGNLGLFSTTDNGASWQAMGSSTNWADPQGIIFDPANPDIFYECGMHGGSIQKTTDGGKTFTILSGNGTTNCDGIGVDWTDPQRKTIVGGWHEAGSVVKSTDAGLTWTNITAGISGSTSCAVVFGPLTYAVTGSQGIWRTTNGGSSWALASSVAPSWNPLVASNGNVYVIANGNQSILKTTNQGATWTTMSKPGIAANQYSPIEMPDGSIVAIGSVSLVQCSNGSSWTPIAGGGGLPSAPGKINGNIAYNSVTKSFFAAFWDCGSTVPANAIWRLDSPSSTVIGLQSNSNSHLVNQHALKLIAGSGAQTYKGQSFDLYNLSGCKLRDTAHRGSGISILQHKFH